MSNSFKTRCLGDNSTLWEPHQMGLIKELEAVQHRFLRFVSINCNVYICVGKSTHHMSHPLDIFNLNTLEM